MTDGSSVPWIERPTLRLDAAAPAAERFRGLADEVVTEARRLLEEISQHIPPAARRLADLVRVRTVNRFHAEAVAMAGMVGADWRDIMMANLSYDLVLATLGCSTLALPTASGPVLARNMDWFPEDVLARGSYLLRIERDGELQFANAGWPGAIGVVSGLSARGFAVALNAVLEPEGVDRLGYPVLLHIRRVVEDARDFADALDQLSQPRLAAPCLLTLVGTDNDERVVIERTPRRHALRWGRPGEALVATNDYRELFRPETHAELEIYRTTCNRYDALCRFFADHDPHREVGDEELLYVLTDPLIIQSITAQHVIARPRQQSVRLFVPRKFIQPPPTCETAPQRVV